MPRMTQLSGQAAREFVVARLPVTERKLNVHGVPTALLQGGSSPPIVLLQVEFGVVWMRVIPKLVSTHRVITPDIPGLGASEIPDWRLDADNLLSWLAELIDQTCASPPVLVGKGPAGALAARFAVEHGDRLDRLVLVDSHGLGRFRPPLGMMLGYLRVLLRPTEQGLDRSFRNYCFVDLDSMRADMGERYDWMATYALDRFRTPSVRTAMRQLMSSLSTPIPPERLARIAVPTTLIWGRHNLGMPLHIAEAASARYGWPLHVIEDARDDPALEQPEAFLAALHAALLP